MNDVLVTVPVDVATHRRLLERASAEGVSPSDLLRETVETFEAFATDHDRRVGRLFKALGLEKLG